MVMVEKVIRFLTGIKPTGVLHLGNYIGAIKPFTEMLQQENTQGLLFVADGHALTSVMSGTTMRAQTGHVAAAWLAALETAGVDIGLDKEQKTREKQEASTCEDDDSARRSMPVVPFLFYRQSTLPQIFELFWILCCLCPKGLMNRAHAYKAAVQTRLEIGAQDVDRDVMMGLFNYPVLMAADILLFGAHQVPVGPDQVQHVEYARDLAQKFNQAYGETFVLPKAVTPEAAPALVGLDGRKMSKSYNNIIPLMASSEQLCSAIKKIKTNAQKPHEPKDPATCHLFTLYKAFATQMEVKEMQKRYATGIGWADMKNITFNVVDGVLAPLRVHYEALIKNPKRVSYLLEMHEKHAGWLAEKTMRRVRRKIGFAER